MINPRASRYDEYAAKLIRPKFIYDTRHPRPGLVGGRWRCPIPGLATPVIKSRLIVHVIISGSNPLLTIFGRPAHTRYLVGRMNSHWSVWLYPDSAAEPRTSVTSKAGAGINNHRNRHCTCRLSSSAEIFDTCDTRPIVAKKGGNRLNECIRS